MWRPSIAAAIDDARFVPARWTAGGRKGRPYDPPDSVPIDQINPKPNHGHDADKFQKPEPPARLGSDPLEKLVGERGAFLGQRFEKLRSLFARLLVDLLSALAHFLFDFVQVQAALLQSLAQAFFRVFEKVLPVELSA